MSSETTWTLEDLRHAAVEIGLSKSKWHRIQVALEAIAARRSQPAPEAVPALSCPSGWHVAGSPDCLHAADRAKAKAGEQGVLSSPVAEDDGPPTHRCDPRDEAACAGDCSDPPPAAPPGFRVPVTPGHVITGGHFAPAKVVDPPAPVAVPLVTPGVLATANVRVPMNAPAVPQPGASEGIDCTWCDRYHPPGEMCRNAMDVRAPVTPAAEPAAFGGAGFCLRPVAPRRTELGDAMRARDCWTWADLHDAIEAERDDLRAKIATAERRIADLEARLAGTRVDLAEAQRSYVSASSQRDALRDQLAEQKTAFDASAILLTEQAQSLIDIRAQLATRDARIAGLEATGADLVRRAQEAERQATGHAALSATRHDRVVVLEAEVAELRGKLAAAEREAAARSSLAELGEPCVGCGKRSRITTAGCDHCDYEDK